MRKVDKLFYFYFIVYYFIYLFNIFILFYFIFLQDVQKSPDFKMSPEKAV